MSYLVISYPTKPGVFCCKNNGYDMEIFKNKTEAIKRASKLKNGPDWTETVVILERDFDGDRSHTIIAGYVPDKWEGSEYIRGYKFSENDVPNHIEYKFEDFPSI